MIGPDLLGEAGNITAYSGGVLVYSGSESAPTRPLGTYSLVGRDLVNPYTLTITDVCAVPDPEFYPSMRAGVGALGFVAARRRKVRLQPATARRAAPGPA